MNEPSGITEDEGFPKWIQSISMEMLNKNDFVKLVYLFGI